MIAVMSRAADRWSRVSGTEIDHHQLRPVLSEAECVDFYPGINRTVESVQTLPS